MIVDFLVLLGSVGLLFSFLLLSAALIVWLVTTFSDWRWWRFKIEDRIPFIRYQIWRLNRVAAGRGYPPLVAYDSATGYLTYPSPFTGKPLPLNAAGNHPLVMLLHLAYWKNHPASARYDKNDEWLLQTLFDPESTEVLSI